MENWCKKFGTDGGDSEDFFFLIVGAEDMVHSHCSQSPQEYHTTCFLSPSAFLELFLGFITSAKRQAGGLKLFCKG